MRAVSPRAFGRTSVGRLAQRIEHYHRTAPYLLSPQTLYECVGDVPNVVFPCAALVDGDTGRVAIYYGCADTVTGLAFAYIDELIEFVQTYSEV